LAASAERSPPTQMTYCQSTPNHSIAQQMESIEDFGGTSRDESPQNNKKRKEKDSSVGPNPRKQKLSKKKRREIEKLEDHKEKLIERVRQWSGNSEDVVNRARDAVEHITMWQPKQFPFPCPVPGCQTRLLTQEVSMCVINYFLHVIVCEHSTFLVIRFWTCTSTALEMASTRRTACKETQGNQTKNLLRRNFFLSQHFPLVVPNQCSKSCQSRSSVR